MKFPTLLLRGGVIWFKVSDKYEKYLTTERSDAYLIGVLHYAMVNKHDITCLSPVSETLLYNLETFFIDSLVKNSTSLYRPKIIAPIASEALDCYNAVGTGASMGVDCMHSIVTHTNSIFVNHNLTHLSFHNVGASYGPNSPVYQERLANAQFFCKNNGYELVVSDSNFMEIIPQNHYMTHPYSSAFAIFCLQKLWGTYYYASGAPFSEFSLIDNDLYSPDRHELLTFNAFSTDTLRIYSEGANLTRLQKIQEISNHQITYVSLNVCSLKGHNCGLCEKCIRTMAALDAIGHLEDYKKVFPVEKYYSNYNYYLGRIYYYHLRKLHAFEELYPYFKNKIGVKARYQALKYAFSLINKKIHGK